MNLKILTDREARLKRIHTVLFYLYKIQKQAKQEKIFSQAQVFWKTRNQLIAAWIGFGEKFPVNGHEKPFGG